MLRTLEVATKDGSPVIEGMCQYPPPPRATRARRCAPRNQLGRGTGNGGGTPHAQAAILDALTPPAAAIGARRGGLVANLRGEGERTAGPSDLQRRPWEEANPSEEERHPAGEAVP